MTVDDRRPAMPPLLVRPWEAGVTGWLVVFGAVLAELAGGAVTNQMSTAVAVPALVVPVAVAAGFAGAQWWQARSYRAEPASWWHLGGIAAALLTWVLWPTQPGILYGATSAATACAALPTTATADCLHRAGQALDAHDITWWLTGALIVGAVALVRRSRIAAWATIPLAFAGCQLASHYLQALLLYYHAALGTGH